MKTYYSEDSSMFVVIHKSFATDTIVLSETVVKANNKEEALTIFLSEFKQKLKRIGINLSFPIISDVRPLTFLSKETPCSK